MYEKNKWIKNTLEYNSSYRDSSIIFFNKGFDNIQFKHLEINSVSHFILNGGGPVLKLNSNNLAITPISPFVPRGWNGSKINNKSFIKMEQ